MNEEIKPALTPEQWRNIARLNDDDLGSHAYAAVLLYGQPFGFTHDDVEFLRLVAGQWRALRLGDHQLRVFDSIADRIAALLPPQP